MIKIELKLITFQSSPVIDWLVLHCFRFFAGCVKFSAASQTWPVQLTAATQKRLFSPQSASRLVEATAQPAFASATQRARCWDTADSCCWTKPQTCRLLSRRKTVQPSFTPPSRQNRPPTSISCVSEQRATKQNNARTLCTRIRSSSTSLCPNILSEQFLRPVTQVNRQLARNLFFCFRHF